MSKIEPQHILDGSAWEQFCDRLKTLAPEVTRSDIPGGEQDRAEGVRHLTRLLSYALDVAVEFSDSDRPVFHPHPQLSYKWGGDNPDNLYLHAAVDGDKTYRIRGRRGSELEFIIQANSCGPMEARGPDPGAGRR